MFCEAVLASQDQYTKNHDHSAEEFDHVLTDLKANVAAGKIQLLDPRFWMTPEEGRAQVEFANNYFSQVRDSVQRLLAGWNYDDFTPSTMQTGEGLLGQAGFDNLRNWTEKGLQYAMPHLVLSNMAMGEMLRHMLLKMPADQALSILDTGSGTGCTLAGSILGIQEAMTQGMKTTRVSITGIEGTLSFFDTLKPFADVALPRIMEVNLEQHIFDEQNTNNHTVKTGEMNMIYGDILETVKALEFSQEIKEGVLVVTANYVWHRLPSSVKKELIGKIIEKAPNVVFLVADLVQNGSAVNRGYFNFTPNGPLNCGNIGLGEIFEREGCTVTPLNENTAPPTMNSALAKKIGEGTTTDSIFYIAYCGEKAAALFN